MCNLSEGIYECGRDDERVKAIQSVMASLKVSVQPAMEIICISEEEQEKYVAVISS
ncbi:hypothetical protein [Selenomonas sp. AB3002]|uniref:hypothetical protein n=1 Tax=Selenomonas sp. AB3002 TaxID=1392502 RepID=UPI00163B5A5C